MPWLNKICPGKHVQSVLVTDIYTVCLVVFVIAEMKSLITIYCILHERTGKTACFVHRGMTGNLN